jgi:hypothetical protein
MAIRRQRHVEDGRSEQQANDEQNPSGVIECAVHEAIPPKV